MLEIDNVKRINLNDVLNFEFFLQKEKKKISYNKNPNFIFKSIKINKIFIIRKVKRDLRKSFRSIYFLYLTPKDDNSFKKRIKDIFYKNKDDEKEKIINKRSEEFFDFRFKSFLIIRVKFDKPKKLNFKKNDFIFHGIKPIIALGVRRYKEIIKKIDDDY